MGISERIPIFYGQKWPKNREKRQAKGQIQQKKLTERKREVFQRRFF
jgi:hypothetical protein